MGNSLSAAEREAAETERESLLGGNGSAAMAEAGLSKLKEKLGITNPPEEPPCPCLPDLSYATRMMGFAFCFLLGLLLSLTSMSSFAGVLVGHPGPFAFKYTLGNVLSICSYCFLVGPKHQCAGMFAPQRRSATLAFLVSLAVTLVSVFYLRSFFVTVSAIVLQFVAMVYYALSYIPYGHAMCSRVFGLG